MRIVSLIPSATEIISSLGLIDKLIGVSHECDNPKEVIKLPKLTRSNIKIKQSSLNIDKDIKKILNYGLSVYEVNSDLLKKLNPDFILTQSQCSVCAVSYNDVSKSLRKWLGEKPKLIDLKPNNFNDVLMDIQKTGESLDVADQAIRLINKIKKEILWIKEKLRNEKVKKILCIEWLDPLMVAGNWIPDLLSFSKGQSIIGESGKHSPFIKLENINEKDFDYIIIMPCGYDIFKTKCELEKFNYLFMKVFKHKKKFIVDGNKYFNRPSTSLLESIKILCEIIHPNIFLPQPSYERWIEI